jgi:tRNA threonylcarbamoyladenosine biosynthesis protein TsaB
MIDARRDEVFTAVLDRVGQFVVGPTAAVLDKDSFQGFLDDSYVLFFGSGAQKFSEMTNSKKAHFIQDFQNSATGIVPLAEAKYTNKDFEDVAYFEPAYLKEFVAGK